MNNDILTNIPTNKSEWNIAVLNQLIKLRNIETDAFDFKSDYKKIIPTAFCIRQ
jgi:hypothetical protein